MDPILSRRMLERCLGKTRERLEEIATSINPRYHQFPQRSKKNPAKIRMITAPEAELKEVQARLLTLLSQIPLSDGVHGGVRGRSPRTNAEAHMAQPYVVNVDVPEFFPSIRHENVYRLFRHELGWGKDVARIATRLTTYHGAVPQGAPTSTAIANLLLAQTVDEHVGEQATALGASSTRFVDDLTFSGSNPTPLIQISSKRLSAKGLRIYRKKAKFQPKPKLRITPNWQRQEVTGLVVNGKGGPTVSRAYRDNVRGAIHALRKETNKRLLDKSIHSIRSRIAYIKPYNPGPAERLTRYLNSVLAQLNSSPHDSRSKNTLRERRVNQQSQRSRTKDLGSAR
jgi:RNA-directed DNA polymerase